MADHKDHGSGNWTSRTGDGFGRSLPDLWRDAEAEGDSAHVAGRPRDARDEDAAGNARNSDFV